MNPYRTSKFTIGTDNVWAPAADGLKSVYMTAAGLARTIVGIAALVLLVIAVIELSKGERDAAVKLMKWFTGCVFFAVLLSVLMKFF